MSSEVTQAFAHPLARSEASQGSVPPDRISLRDHVVSVDIGAFQKERGRAQRVSFNVVVEVCPHQGASTDDVDRILSYDRVTEAIAHELAAERLNLLETLAERIAERILLEPQALRVFVRIEKLDRGPGALGVEIVRARQDAPPPPEDVAPVRPIVVHLSNQAVWSPLLPQWLDQLTPLAPVILSVDPSPAERPDARHKLAQRRIDLLAIEQNGWVLSGRDPRCVVVGTRTELDWSMRNGQTAVWAPSKMVLDAVAGPASGQTGDLLRWFATEIGAAYVVVVDGADLAGVPCPVTGLHLEHAEMPVEKIQSVL